MPILNYKNCRILVVDDTPENIQVIGTVLRKKGFRISIAGSGQEALDIVTEELPDLILLDILMPGINGFETCRQLKQIPAAKDTPVIFMSALTETGNKVKGFEAGAVDYVTKPVETEELLARINAHLTIKFLHKELARSNERLQDQVAHRTRELEHELAQRKVAEKAAQKSEAKHRALLETTNTGYVIMDDNGMVVDANGEYVRLTGHGRREDILGRSVLEWTAPYHVDKHTEEIRKAVTSGFVRGLEIDYAGPDERITPIEINATRVETEEGPVFLTLCRDVTQRKQMAEIMVQTEKMMSLGGLAHEINNPLAGILHNIQVIQNRVSNDLPANIIAAQASGTSLEAIRAYMEKRALFRMINAIYDAGKAAARIVENFLSFSRKDTYSFSYEHLGRLLDKTLEICAGDYDLKKKYDFRQIEIRREYAPNLPLVPCSENKIRQVFFNILKNGAHAMAGNDRPPRFTLRVLAEQATGTPPAQEMLRVEIEDNGPGMDEDTRKRIFEPFYTTKPVGTGTGLGLSISYFIITDNHKGSIWVVSVPGQGTKFIIRLPRTKETP